MTVSDTSLRLERVLAAPIERVWAQWTDPAKLASWFAPGSTWGCRVDRLELRPGGSYAVDMIDPAGDVHRVSGRYLRIEAPNLLEFTWAWFHAPAELSRVRVKLLSVKQGTRLRLDHKRLSGPESINSHTDGWNKILGRLHSLNQPTGEE